jgi:DNA excision repair protein ERCC-5
LSLRPAPDIDPDLREYQRETALAAISRRPSNKGLASISKKPTTRSSVFARPEFALFDERNNEKDEDGEELQMLENAQLAHALAASIDDNNPHPTVNPTNMEHNDDEDDEEMELAYAVAESLESSNSLPQTRATPSKLSSLQTPSRPGATSSSITGSTPRTSIVSDLSLLMQDSPNRLETALAIAGAGSRRTSGNLSTSAQKPRPVPQVASGSLLRTPTPKSEKEKVWPVSVKDEDGKDEGSRSSLGVGKSASASLPVGSLLRAGVEEAGKEEESSMFGKPSLLLSSAQPSLLSTANYLSPSQDAGPNGSTAISNSGSKISAPSLKSTSLLRSSSNTMGMLEDNSDDEKMEEDILPIVSTEDDAVKPKPSDNAKESASDEDDDMEEVQVDPPVAEIVTDDSLPSHAPTSGRTLPAKPAQNSDGSDDDSDGERLIPWSRSPSPDADETSFEQQPRAEEKKAKQDQDEAWDAAQEMDVHAEEGDFARFVSQVKGQDLDAVRREIDEEIKGLNQQKKAALRDSEEVTQHMVAQIMVRLSSLFYTI